MKLIERESILQNMTTFPTSSTRTYFTAAAENRVYDTSALLIKVKQPMPERLVGSQFYSPLTSPPFRVEIAPSTDRSILLEMNVPLPSARKACTPYG